MAPFMELRMERLTLRHHMMYDHDLLEGDFLLPIINDLTMWPRTSDPMTYKEKAEQFVS